MYLMKDTVIRHVCPEIVCRIFNHGSVVMYFKFCVNLQNFVVFMPRKSTKVPPLSDSHTHDDAASVRRHNNIIRF